MGRPIEEMTNDFDRLASEAYSAFRVDAIAHKTKVTISTESIESVKSMQDNLNALAAVVRVLI